MLFAGVHGDGADGLARILVHLGVDQAGEPDDFPGKLKALNREILESAGFDQFSIEPLHAGWYASLRHAEFHERAVDLVSAAFASSSLFVLKDHAIAQLIPFWRKVLEACGVDAVVIDYHDDPARFASGFSQLSGVSGSAARAVWLARVLECEHASRGMVRAHLTREALLDDWEAALGRLSQALGITWPAWSARVRKAIVGELIPDEQDANDRALRRVPQADQVDRWVRAAQDILWRWAQDGEDDHGRAQMDELRAVFDEAREPLGLAFATVAEMGEKLRLQKQVADGLSARLADLQRQSDAMRSSAPPARPGEKLDRPAAASPADAGEPGTAEARWEKVFRWRIHEAEVLTEKNGVLQAAIERLKAEAEALETRRANAAKEVERLRLLEIAGKAELGAARSEVAALRKSQDDLRKSFDEVQKSLAEARRREVAIERVHNAQLASAARGGSGRAIVAPSKSIGQSVKSLLLYVKPKARKKMLQHRRQRRLVLESGMFDAPFYAARYPDVVVAGVDLLDHFISSGGAEGRHPSPAFNSKWYLSEYPDIRESGLNPLVHYLEHGRDEGRRRRALTDSTTIASARTEASAAPTSESQRALEQVAAPPPEVRAATSELEGTWRPRIGGWKALRSSGPDQLSAIMPLDRLGQQPQARAIAVGDKIVAVLASETPRPAFARIALFAAMRSGAAAAVTVAGEPATAEAPHVILADHGCGLELLADGWCDSRSGLTLRLAGGLSSVARVFQADCDGHLHCVAEAVTGGGEADYVEVRSVDPLAPLLVLVSRGDGVLVDSAVVPFPSLLRGGLHYGELAVLETAPGSMASLAEYSRTLALEWLGWDQGPDRHAIGRIEIDMRGASGTEPIFRPAVLSSIARHFGMPVRAVEGSYPSQRDQLVAMLEPAGQASTIAARITATGVLVLPSDAVPSIYALVARRMPHDPALSRFVVVDAATIRPTADVSLPFDEDLARFQHPDMPAHAPHVLSPENRDAGRGGPVFPLAVRHYNKLAWQADPLMPVSPDREMPVEVGTRIDKAITVVIDSGRNPEGMANCLAALENQIGAESLDVILAGWPDDQPLPPCELQVRSIDGRELTLAGRLNAAAELSGADRLMFLAPGVLLSDPRTAAALSRLADRPATASVACALVTELHDEGDAKVHSAGYFPSRVSLHGEPVFDFDQIDIARIMPAATFPVVANHAKCVLYDAATFRSLGGFDQRRFPMAMHDLDLGFRALAAGHTNLCTTLVRAAVDEAALSADFPDPLAHRSVRPADWQSLLDRVAVVRELRR
ncbi:hypothetical protein IP79_07705 [Porphyrobacter sp. AAP60]|nr:hypothetical protein IP79_07705 [Porphyrobacter sp. AAP60]